MVYKLKVFAVAAAGRILFYNLFFRCREASLSFGLRKRVTRESNLRGVSAMRSSPLKNPLLFSARTQRAPRRGYNFLNNAACGTVRARARAAIARGFLGGFERFTLIPPESFSWYRSFATQKNDTPAPAGANLINKIILPAVQRQEDSLKSVVDLLILL